MTEYKDVVTVTVTADAVLLTTAPVKKRGDTVTAPAPESIVPAYLSDRCSDAEQYSHACACMTVSASTVTVAVAGMTSTTTIASTTTWYESPPLASSSVVFPDDNSWTATYTYSEYELPVFTSAPDPTVIVDYPTPTPVCLMGSTLTGDAFVSRTAQLSLATSYLIWTANIYQHYSTSSLQTPDTLSRGMALSVLWNSRPTRLQPRLF